MATVPARLIELGQAGRENATESQKNDDGSHSLTQIDFAGKKYALAFGMASLATEVDETRWLEVFCEVAEA